MRVLTHTFSCSEKDAYIAPQNILSVKFYSFFSQLSSILLPCKLLPLNLYFHYTPIVGYSGIGPEIESHNMGNVVSFKSLLITVLNK